MNILADVFKELFKMFVADLRLTLTLLAGVALIGALRAFGVIAPVAGGLVLAAFSIAVLCEAVMRETRSRKGR